ncbi:MAG: hypothetical protein J5753_03605 [Oscillospiraceae bacterium]|nr:hypothetical protein [Oscillospiraceae bacterium]
MIIEIILTVVIVIAVLLLIGVSVQTIISSAVMILLGLVALAMLSIILFFFLTDLFLPFRKAVKGRFLRVDEEGRMDHAVYQVGEQEYTCSFPAESFGRKRIYQTEKDYLLLIPRSGKRKTAYDRHSLVTIAIGTIISVVLVFVLAFGISYIRSFI